MSENRISSFKAAIKKSKLQYELIQLADNHTCNELTIPWVNDETEKGKTLSRYINGNNTITVEDFVMNNGEYYKFGSTTYVIKD